MFINNTDALRWLVCVVISLCLPFPMQKTGLLFSLVFVLVSARSKQRKFLFFWLSSVLRRRIKISRYTKRGLSC